MHIIQLARRNFWTNFTIRKRVLKNFFLFTKNLKPLISLVHLFIENLQQSILHDIPIYIYGKIMEKQFKLLN